MKLSLYEIEKSQLEVVEQLIENCGELTAEIEELLKINAENLTTKGTNYGFIIKQMTAECGIIDAEIERLRKYPNKEYVVTESNYIHPYGDGTYAAMLLPDNHRKICTPSAH